MTEAERLVERLETEAQELSRMAWGRQDGGQECSLTANLATEAAAFIQQQAERIEALEEALERLPVAAALLLENAKECAVNHYGADFSEQGLPGWLADCARDIEAASNALAPFPNRPAQAMMPR